MATEWPAHDPDELLDYGIDWSTRLEEGDRIVASTWTTPPGGPTLSTPGRTDTATTIWITGGTAGESYRIGNRVTTAAGRVMDDSKRLTVREK
ncbi:MAG: hypothetical protein BWX69_03144 [Planctomycetes bacterium ADurb.Bin069]|nr:MAG: hypothetical protein BWX69_03144 [Planctomycetes bacterium ADurb.Bin069]